MEDIFECEKAVYSCYWGKKNLLTCLNQTIECGAEDVKVVSIFQPFVDIKLKFTPQIMLKRDFSFSFPTITQ